MIASLDGTLERSSPGEVVLEVGGVGYRVRVSVSTFASLPETGRRARLRIATVVREDEISLYGFATAEEEELFGLLQGVAGVGPRLALKILSGLAPDALRQALASGDLRALTSVPGVGKKLAERLALELRDRVSALGRPAAGPAGRRRVEEEALEALVALGYPVKTAQKALEDAAGQGAPTLEGLVRDALRALAPRR